MSAPLPVPLFNPAAVGSGTVRSAPALLTIRNETMSAPASLKSTVPLIVTAPPGAWNAVAGEYLRLEIVGGCTALGDRTSNVPDSRFDALPWLSTSQTSKSYRPTKSIETTKVAVPVPALTPAAVGSGTAGLGTGATGA